MAYTIGEIDQMPASVYLDKFNNEPGFRLSPVSRR